MTARVFVGLRLTPEAVAWAEGQAERLGVSRSEVLRQAMRAGMGAVAQARPKRKDQS